MARLIDFSPPITPRIGVWPGDTPFRQEYLARMADGANLDLSTIHTTVHLGAHADAPGHYGQDAPGIGERPLQPYYGPCQVVRVEVGRGQRIVPGHLADQGVVLVGIDTPSIDPQDDARLHSHKAGLARDLSVLEGLVLSHVPPGEYTLVALTWRLMGADASPVRAVLVDD